MGNNKIQGKKCFVIGGAGFIGKSLVRKLKEDKYDVTVYDIVDNPFKEKEIHYIKGDYFGKKLPANILMGQDIVFLLACSVNPAKSMEQVNLCYQNDIVRMIELLDEMKKSGIEQMFFISSGGTVYGDSMGILTENMKTFPINHYGIMKLTQENILLMYNKLYGMRNIIFRLSNPYGIEQNIASGVGAVTNFLYKITSRQMISIYGDGKQKRDYIYISDIVEMMCLFMKKELPPNEIPIYNIGTGKGVSLLELIDLIQQITGIEAKVKFLEERSIDVKENVLCNNKICKIIGEYECISIYDGIKRYYLYLKESSKL